MEEGLIVNSGNGSIQGLEDNSSSHDLDVFLLRKFSIDSRPLIPNNTLLYRNELETMF